MTSHPFRVGRSPYGERGLKYVGCSFRVLLFLSLSLRRAWIEIRRHRSAHRHQDSRSPYGERGLKFGARLIPFSFNRSLSLRRAWIEIPKPHWPTPCKAWSLSLRRAWIEITRGAAMLVEFGSLSLRRAWIEISTRPTGPLSKTGRSPYGERGLKFGLLVSWVAIWMSLSLRRAWIEITCCCRWIPAGRVALLTESVD